MSYKCQVCGKVTATNLGMRIHIVNAKTLFLEHLQWMKSNGVSPPKQAAAGNYQPLEELVERTCKVKD